MGRFMNILSRLENFKQPPPPIHGSSARDMEATFIGHGKAPQNPSISAANTKARQAPA